MRATILNASAGSGKTYTLAYKYVKEIIAEPMLYRNVLAVTFTNKATEEMKSRILSEIDKLASGAKSNYLEQLIEETELAEPQIRKRAEIARTHILHDYTRFTILTIDKFFQRIIRAFIQELGLNIDYNIEIETSSMLTQSVDALIEKITTDDQMRKWLSEYVGEMIEQGKKWDIRSAITTLGGEIFKESNYERLNNSNNLSKEELKELIGRITAHSKSSKKEAIELAQKAMQMIKDGGCKTSDFSGKTRSFANYFQTVATCDTPPEPKKTIREKSMSCEKWCDKSSPALPLVAELQPILYEIVKLYDDNIMDWNTADLLSENYRSYALLSDLYEMVQSLCEEQNLMLLSQTKMILAQFIADNDAPFIYEKIGTRFDKFMIDEFQDTSAKEWGNFLPLLTNAMSQSETSSVLIVGDIKQSIYRWRGGDWRILHSQALEDLGRLNAEVLNLKNNFRSRREIVEFNNSIIESVVKSGNDILNTELETATAKKLISNDLQSELTDMLQSAYTNHAQTPRKSDEASGYIELTIHSEEPNVIERIKNVLDLGYLPSQILILVRGARDGLKIADTLLEFKRENLDKKYYFDVMTQEALIVGASPISSFIISILSLAVEPTDSMQLAIYNNFRDTENNIDQPLSDEDIEFLRTIRLLSPVEAFERIVIKYELSAARNNIAYLQAIHEQLISFCSSKVGDIPLFLKWWSEVGSHKSISVERSDMSIEITTIHKAKGLENKVVIIPYCNWDTRPKSSGQVSNIVWAEDEQIGAVPIKFKQAMGASRLSADYYREVVYTYIDSINLLYVALTRAVDQLYIFVPEKVSRIGDELLKAVQSSESGVRIGSIEGYIDTTYGDTSYCFGEKCSIKQQTDRAKQSLHIIRDYPTREAELRLSLPSQRYFEEDNEQVVLSPRHAGVLLHKLFEQIEKFEDIEPRLKQMHLNGQISDVELETINTQIIKAFEDPRVKEWFQTPWDKVRNESEIITPLGAGIRRPDRVMIAGKRAIVVDYKFGAEHSPKHIAQIEEYTKLLAQMGYEQIEGYVWYIKSGLIISL